MTLLRSVVLVLGIAFLAGCLLASQTGDFLNEFQTISALAWGKISLADLYLGFLLFAVIILAFEPLRIGLPIVIVLFVLGNWVAAIWLAIRLPNLVKRLRQNR